MITQHIVTGMFNNEIFIARIEGGKRVGFDVIRPVSEKNLEERRDIDEMADSYKWMWKEAVAADRTEQGFDEWLQDIWDEEFDEDDPEDFPGKESSDCQYLTDEIRAKADEIVEAATGEPVGTWESSGWYDPGHCGYKNDKFTGWQYIFDKETALAFVKEKGGKLKK